MNYLNCDNEIERIHTQSKGLIPGIVTAWYTVLVAVAAIHGLGIFQSIIAIISFDANMVFSGGDGWMLVLALFIDTASFLLPVLAAKEIYGRRKRGLYLAFASAVLCAARIALIMLIDFTQIWSVVLLSAVAIAILVPAQASKKYLLSDEELRRIESTL